VAPTLGQYAPPSHRISSLVDRGFAFHPRPDAAGQLAATLDALRALRELQAAIDGRIMRLGEKAQKQGAGWADIGRALRITRQAAQQKWRPTKRNERT